MVGGHGTAGSFGPLLEDLGVANANVVAIASATFGLVAGCAIGGPIAYAKIKKYNLGNMAAAGAAAEAQSTDDEEEIKSDRVLPGLLYLIIAIGLGTIVSAGLIAFCNSAVSYTHLTLPTNSRV